VGVLEILFTNIASFPAYILYVYQLFCFLHSDIYLATYINSDDVYRLVVVFQVVLVSILFPVFSIVCFSFSLQIWLIKQMSILHVK